MALKRKKGGLNKRAAFSFGCGDGDSNPNALRRQNDTSRYRLIPAAGQNTLRTKLCQPASHVSKFGSPLNDEDSTGNTDFGDLKKLVSKIFQAEINNLRDV